MSLDLEFIAICEHCKKQLSLTEFDDNLDTCLTCHLDKIKLTVEEKKILSIDVGIKNLGMTVMIVNDNYDFISIPLIQLIDITKFDCLPNCKLNHTKTFADWIEHVVVKYNEIFKEVDYILVERQPPCGLVAIEQIFFSKYREKAFLISPTSVHKFFSIGSFDYETRKYYSTQIASKYLEPDVLKSYERKHDITDTILFSVYWIHKLKEEKKRKELLDRRNSIIKKYNKGLGMSIEEFFHAFRYIPSKNCLRTD